MSRVGASGPAPKRLRSALRAAVPEADPVVVRPLGRDLVRFVAPANADRVSAAAAAVVAAVRSGRTDKEAVAEWRGRGAAVAFADFGPKNRPAAKTAEAGPGALIDRGRFFVEWNKGERVLVAGIAEYAFEGNFDYFE